MLNSRRFCTLIDHLSQAQSDQYRFVFDAYDGYYVLWQEHAEPRSTEELYKPSAANTCDNCELAREDFCSKMGGGAETADSAKIVGPAAVEATLWTTSVMGAAFSGPVRYNEARRRFEVPLRLAQLGCRTYLTSNCSAVPSFNSLPEPQ